MSESPRKGLRPVSFKVNGEQDKGFFHQFISSGEAVSAVVERLDGTVKLVKPYYLKFEDVEEHQNT